jgi:hypothetical protein
MTGSQVRILFAAPKVSIGYAVFSDKPTARIDAIISGFDKGPSGGSRLWLKISATGRALRPSLRFCNSRLVYGPSIKLRNHAGWPSASTSGPLSQPCPNLGGVSRSSRQPRLLPKPATQYQPSSRVAQEVSIERSAA